MVTCWGMNTNEYSPAAMRTTDIAPTARIVPLFLASAASRYTSPLHLSPVSSVSRLALPPPRPLYLPELTITIQGRNSPRMRLRSGLHHPFIYSLHSPVCNRKSAVRPRVFRFEYHQLLEHHGLLKHDKHLECHESLGHHGVPKHHRPGIDGARLLVCRAERNGLRGRRGSYSVHNLEWHASAGESWGRIVYVSGTFCFPIN